MNFPGKSIDELVREELDEGENGEGEENGENGEDESSDSDADADGEANDAPTNNKGISLITIDETLETM